MKSLLTTGSLITFLLSIFIISSSFAQKDPIRMHQHRIKVLTKEKKEVERIRAIMELGEMYIEVDSFTQAIELLETEVDDFSNEIDSVTRGIFLGELAYAYYEKALINFDFEVNAIAVSYFQKSLPYIDKSDDLFLKGKIYSRYGLSLMENYQDKKAIDELKKAIGFFEKNKTLNKGWVNAVGNLGRAYFHIDDYENSIKYLREGKELAKKHGDDEFTAKFSINTGLAFMNLEKNDLAIQNFEEAIKLGEKVNNQKIIGTSLLHLGNIKMERSKPSDWEDGRKQLEKANDIFKILKDERHTAYVNSTLALYHENVENYEQALIYNQRYIDFSKSINSPFVEADGLVRQGRFYGKLEQIDSARICLMQAIDIFKKEQVKEPIVRAYKNLVELEEQAGNHKEALVYYRQFTVYRDSIFQEKVGETIGKESVAQDVEGAEQAQKEAELEAEVLAGRNKLFLAIALGLLGIILIGGYLYQQLQKTRKQLENQNTQLTQLNETKDRFFGIIAHDIRGPITSLDGVGEQMSYYLKKNNTERVNKLTTQIDNTSKKLTNLLDNLLNWALLQKGTIPYHPKSLDIHEVVQENIELYTEVAEMKNIQFVNKVEKETLAFADMSAITTVVRNLINNAVKFTPDGGKISISTAIENENVLIEINDTGTGISAERLEKIFLLNTERKKGTAGEKGSGLGLLLCKDLIELNKGTIRAISELGKGSTFIFSLPTA